MIPNNSAGMEAACISAAEEELMGEFPTWLVSGRPGSTIHALGAEKMDDGEFFFPET